MRRERTKADTTRAAARPLVDYRDNTGVRRAASSAPSVRPTPSMSRRASELAAARTLPTARRSQYTKQVSCGSRGASVQLEAGTLLDYRQHLKLHIPPFLGNAKLSRLTVLTVNGFRDQLLDAGSVTGHGPPRAQVTCRSVGEHKAGDWWPTMWCETLRAVERSVPRCGRPCRAQANGRFVAWLLLLPNGR